MTATLESAALTTTVSLGLIKLQKLFVFGDSATLGVEGVGLPVGAVQADVNDAEHRAGEFASSL